MSGPDERGRAQSSAAGFLRSRAGLALIVFLAVSALLLAFEHRAHIFDSGWLAFGLLGLCLLMHLFMHGGHGHGGHDGDGGDGSHKGGGQ